MKILIADADTHSADILVETVQRLGHQFAAARSFDDVKAQCAATSFNVLFIDAAVIAGGDIKPLARRNMDVIVTMTSDAIHDVPAFMNAGATDIMLKPFEPIDVELVVGRLGRRRELSKDRDILLSENIEFVETIGFYRRILRLASMLDIEELRDTFIDEVLNCTFGESALLYLPTDAPEDAYRCVAFKGGIKHDAIALTVPRATVDDADMSYFISPQELNIPIRFDDRPYGFVKVMTPLIQEGFTEKEFNRAYTICEFIGKVFDNARRFETLRHGPVCDEGTAYSWDVFRGFVRKEVNKALRYERKLAVIAVRIENYERLRLEHRDGSLAAAVQELVDTIQSVIRDSDWLLQRTESEYLIFLTETDYFGALMAIRRLRNALAGKCVVKADDRQFEELAINLTAAGLPIHGSSLEELLGTIEARLQLGNESMIRQLDIHRKTFSPLVSDLFGLFETERWNSAIYDRRTKNPARFANLVSLFLHDCMQNSRRRGVLYAGFMTDSDLHLEGRRDMLSDIACKVYFFMPRDNARSDMAGIVTVGVDTARMQDHRFILYLNEHYSFGYFEDDAHGIETCDDLLVDTFINKLQTEFHLQWQL